MRIEIKNALNFFVVQIAWIKTQAILNFKPEAKTQTCAVGQLLGTSDEMGAFAELTRKMHTKIKIKYFLNSRLQIELIILNTL